MGKIINHGNRKEKGFTLVEVVVALTVIGIVSAATVSLSVYATNSLRLARDKNFLVHETYNFASLYLQYDETDFVGAINNTTKNTETLTYHNFTINYDDNYDYLPDSYNRTFYIDFDFTNSNKTLTLSAYSSTAELLYSRSVER